MGAASNLLGCRYADERRWVGTMPLGLDGVWSGASELLSPGGVSFIFRMAIMGVAGVVVSFAWEVVAPLITRNGCGSFEEREVRIMANLNVTYADIEAMVSNLKSGQEELNNILSKLKSQVDQLVSSGFVTDRASGAFESSYTEFNTGATQAVDGLEGMYTFLTKAQQAMSDLDSQLAGSLG